MRPYGVGEESTNIRCERPAWKERVHVVQVLSKRRRRQGKGSPGVTGAEGDGGRGAR